MDKQFPNLIKVENKNFLLIIKNNDLISQKDLCDINLDTNHPHSSVVFSLDTLNTELYEKIFNNLNYAKLENERINIAKKFNLKFEKFVFDQKNIYFSHLTKSNYIDKVII